MCRENILLQILRADKKRAVKTALLKFYLESVGLHSHSLVQ